MFDELFAHVSRNSRRARFCLCFKLLARNPTVRFSFTWHNGLHLECNWMHCDALGCHEVSLGCKGLPIGGDGMHWDARIGMGLGYGTSCIRLPI
jgi:hypothetical protein